MDACALVISELNAKSLIGLGFSGFECRFNEVVRSDACDLDCESSWFLGSTEQLLRLVTFVISNFLVVEKSDRGVQPNDPGPVVLEILVSQNKDRGAIL